MADAKKQADAPTVIVTGASSGIGQAADRAVRVRARQEPEAAPRGAQGNRRREIRARFRLLRQSAQRCLRPSLRSCQ
jgi:hypothetical protein